MIKEMHGIGKKLSGVAPNRGMWNCTEQFEMCEKTNLNALPSWSQGES